MEEYSKKEQNFNIQQVNETNTSYANEVQAELARLKKNMTMSDMDKLHSFTRMLIRNAMYKRAIVTHHK